jgi:hypothetical protein
MNLAGNWNRKYTETYQWHSTQDITVRMKRCGSGEEINIYKGSRKHESKTRYLMYVLCLSFRKHPGTYSDCCSTWSVNIWRKFSAASMCCATWPWTSPIHHLDTRWVTSASQCCCPWRCTSVDQCSIIRPRTLYLWGPKWCWTCIRLHKSPRRPYVPLSRPWGVRP